MVDLLFVYAEANQATVVTPFLLMGAMSPVTIHAAGWLESGLVASFEKFIIDIELMRVLRAEFTPFAIDEASLAFDAHVEVGHGGHFLGAAHTLTRFRDCFYRPSVATTSNFERWARDGSLEMTQRADIVWRQALERYERPPMDDGIREELYDYVACRRRELGD